MDSLVIEDWYMVETYNSSKIVQDSYTGQEFCDVAKGQNSYRVFGTKQQIREWADTLDEMVDEVYGYEKIERDSYWDGICCKDDDPDDNRNLPTREEYNKKWEENFETYHQMYVKNGNKILIL